MAAGRGRAASSGFPSYSVVLPSTKAPCRSTCSALEISSQPPRWQNTQTAPGTRSETQRSRAELARAPLLVDAVITR